MLHTWSDDVNFRVEQPRVVVLERVASQHHLPIGLRLAHLDFGPHLLDGTFALEEEALRQNVAAESGYDAHTNRESRFATVHHLHAGESALLAASQDCRAPFATDLDVDVHFLDVGALALVLHDSGCTRSVQDHKQLVVAPCSAGNLARHRRLDLVDEVVRLRSALGHLLDSVDRIHTKRATDQQSTV